MRKEKILDLARGFWGRNKNCNKLARMKVEKGLVYQYRDRKVKKREMRSLWVQNTNAAAREYDLSYSKLAHGLTEANVMLNKKVLADLARHEPWSFGACVQIAKLYV